uniref:Coat protein n=1 Tax=Geladintestivirus 5 TaxID=3233137 RepID=A0AAU8MHW4_9CAUD
MTKEAKVSTSRSITGNKAVQIVQYANKLVALNLISTEDRKKYFDAIKALRDLSDQYCEINGLSLV